MIICPLTRSKTSDKGKLRPRKAFQVIHPFHFHNTFQEEWVYDICNKLIILWILVITLDQVKQQAAIPI